MTTLGVVMSALVDNRTLITPFDNTSIRVYNNNIVAMTLLQHLNLPHLLPQLYIEVYSSRFDVTSIRHVCLCTDLSLYGDTCTLLQGPTGT